MVRFSIYFILCTFLFSSCSLFKKDFYADHPCINEKSKNIEIKWGFYITETKELYGFKLDTKGQVFLIDNNLADESLLLTLNKEEYCDIFISINKEIIKTQTLNVPADTNAFITFNNPDMNYDFRAIWDPNYETIGSEGFREIFKKLNKVLPSDTDGKKMYFNFEFKD